MDPGRIKYLSSGSSGRENKRTKDKLKALNSHLSQLFSRNIEANVKSVFFSQLNCRALKASLACEFLRTDSRRPDVGFTAFELLLISQIMSRSWKTNPSNHNISRPHHHRLVCPASASHRHRLFLFRLRQARFAAAGRRAASQRHKEHTTNVPP